VSDTPWRAPEVDEEGFVSMAKLAKRARQISCEEFVERYPAPGLWVVLRDSDVQQGDGVLDPSDSGVQLLTMSIKSTAILRYLNKVGFVCKRPGNPFAHLIAIGRSVRNDLVIGIDTVSKVHGYFVNQDGRWFFTDRTSTNGSAINERPLEPGVRTPIADRDFLRLGIEVTLQFLLPETLWDKARQQ